VLVLVEAFGGIVDETMEELKRLQHRSTGPGAVDRTRYGRHRSSPHIFISASHAAPLCGCCIV
jgi:hypothetical protein